MTNLQARPTAGWLTRERVLVGVPALLGGLLALGATAGLVWPRWQQVQRDQLHLAQLQEQRQRLPLLRRQIAKLQEQQEQQQARREQILGLIAGSGDISTFMAQLSSEAQRSGVQLDSYEPITQAAPEPGRPAAGQGKGADKAPPPPPDPLLAPGLQKTSLLLTARGRGPQLQDFLRRLERLSLLVVQSDLSFKHEADPAGSKGQAAAVGPTSLKLNLAIYAQDPGGPASAPAVPAKAKS